MSFFTELFTKPTKSNNINITYGQQNHNKKSKAQKDAWERSVQLFEKKEYLKAYEEMFEYIKWYDSDNKSENITIKKLNDKIEFEIAQGSILLKGYVTNKVLMVDVDMAVLKTLSSALLRKVLEKNVKYVYSKFYLTKDNHLKMKLNLDNSKMTASKVWHALKELATNADKEDDLLMNDFKSMYRSETDHIVHLSPDIKAIKIKYFRQWIEELNELTNKLDYHEYSSVIGYAWLELLFRVDYLISPQGKLEDDIYQILDNYYSDRDQKSMAEHNSIFRKKFNKLKDKDDKDIEESLFVKKITFLSTSKEDKESVQEFLEKDLSTTKWYEENSHKELAIKIYDYKILFSLYKFNMPMPMLNLMHLYIQVRHNDFFVDMGDNIKFVENTKLNKKLIEKEIKKIAKNYKHTKEEDDDSFAFISFRNSIEYDSMHSFASSFVKALINL